MGALVKPSFSKNYDMNLGKKKNCPEQDIKLLKIVEGTFSIVADLAIFVLMAQCCAEAVTCLSESRLYHLSALSESHLYAIRHCLCNKLYALLQLCELSRRKK